MIYNTQLQQANLMHNFGVLEQDTGQHKLITNGIIF